MIIDTNVLLRVLIREDEQSYHDSFKLLALIKKGRYKALLPGLVFTEMLWVMRSQYQLSIDDATKALKAVLATNNLPVVDEYDYHQAVEWYEQYRIKYVDCQIATLAAKRNGTVVSFDEEFGRLPVPWRRPVEVLALADTESFSV